jgi:GNAT superfamily N-acetyltransferase
MDIAVAPDYQRKGIGTMMLEHIEKLAKERGATMLRSNTGIVDTASQSFTKA